MKNVIDRTLALSLFLMLVVIPVIPITMIAIFIEDPGNVFFTQDRVGKNGKTFRIIKFRSMYKDADKRIKAQIANGTTDALNFKQDASSMVMKVGAFIRKTSIDELPQLLNIIKGDMSIVGPRPLQALEVEVYCTTEQHQEIMAKRLSLKPGLLCDWQITPQKEQMPFDERMLLDCSYVDKQSLTEDVSLIAKGIKTVLYRNNM
ncbi:sugar transferase [Streptococcus hyointestinalis]|uniref:sugar transferase n=1 Tax=Streptococcus hyointestinalis TaxID=1337 RepID=UPI0035111495